jgi:hypothetical protein
MRIVASAFAIAAGLGLVAASAAPAAAKCTKLGFEVNDFGKEGPTRDAKALLDKYIAQWAAERGIKNYRVGKKDVSCELYLNLIVVDEHTCKATATVCWGGSGGAAQQTATPSKKVAPGAASATAPPKQN